MWVLLHYLVGPEIPENPFAHIERIEYNYHFLNMFP